MPLERAAVTGQEPTPLEAALAGRVEAHTLAVVEAEAATIERSRNPWRSSANGGPPGTVGYGTR